MVFPPRGQQRVRPRVGNHQLPRNDARSLLEGDTPRGPRGREGNYVGLGDRKFGKLIEAWIGVAMFFSLHLPDT